jgi:hypothetical protein
MLSVQKEKMKKNEKEKKELFQTRKLPIQNSLIEAQKMESLKYWIMLHTSQRCLNNKLVARAQRCTRVKCVYATCMHTTVSALHWVTQLACVYSKFNLVKSKINAYKVHKILITY